MKNSVKVVTYTPKRIHITLNEIVNDLIIHFKCYEWKLILIKNKEKLYVNYTNCAKLKNNNKCRNIMI